MDLEEEIRQAFIRHNNKVPYKSLAEMYKFKFLENERRIVNLSSDAHLHDFVLDENFKNEFKKVVNKLSTIKDEEGEKFLILRAKYQRKSSVPDLLQKTVRADGLRESILQALTGSPSIDDSSDFDLYDCFDVKTPARCTLDNALGTHHEQKVLSEQAELVEQSAAAETENTGALSLFEECSAAVQSLVSEHSSEKQVALMVKEESLSNKNEVENLQPVVIFEGSIPKFDGNKDENLVESLNLSSESEKMKRYLQPLNGNHSKSSEAVDVLGTDAKKIRITLNDEASDTSLSLDSPKDSNVKSESSTTDSGSSEATTVKARATSYSNIIQQNNNENERKNYQAHKNKSRHNQREDTNSPESSSVASSVSLSANERAWLVASAKCDYQAISKMLSSNPDLSNFVDFSSGYSALHYAAKFGSSDAVKLLAGKFKADVDRRSGYTPLHLAAMHAQYATMELLIKTYGANQTIRDNSGRRAEHYVNNAFLTKRVTAADLSAHKAMSSSSTSSQSNQRTNMRNSYSSQSLPSALQQLSVGGFIQLGSIRKAGSSALNRLRKHPLSTDNFDSISADDQDSSYRLSTSSMSTAAKHKSKNYY